MKALAGDPQKRHADMAALGRDLVARPRGKIGRHLAVSVVVALLLASTISYPFWRPVADRLYAYEASESKDRAALKLRPGDGPAAELARTPPRSAVVSRRSGSSNGPEIATRPSRPWPSFEGRSLTTPTFASCWMSTSRRSSPTAEHCCKPIGSTTH